MDTEYKILEVEKRARSCQSLDTSSNHPEISKNVTHPKHFMKFMFLPSQYALSNNHYSDSNSFSFRNQEKGFNSNFFVLLNDLIDK